MKIELSEIKEICEEVIIKAESNIADSDKPFDRQYYIGRKQAAQDILDKMKHEVSLGE